ncbi:DUF934 domain-containing protein [Halovulum dunhuangense]|uniref:DUF934 domain-containing protein n=1 Tax=Halovulum dunhuangense TaxID=1505036 RepID=A0A849KZK0_9RHOB|nr:DUF934 domain-containing protein [Halovulum dunhuangense]NNU79194.1 DUF934 domain-containing protein [Halovulum dunhuangense]
MTQIVTRDGFVADSFPRHGVILDLDAYWTGQDLPIDVPLGVRLPVDADPERLRPWFGKISLAIIPFASSADGRGFSLARRLRQLGYRGRIRAEGHVLVDQFRAALRVGVDEIAISDAQALRNPEAQWLAVRHVEGYQNRLFAA